MKRYIYRLLITAVLLALLCVGTASAGIGDKLYFNKYPTLVEDLINRWGEPKAKYTSADGYDFYIFNYGYQGGVWENRYFVVKEGRVIDGGFNFNPYTMEDWSRP
jgi:hypothetical protein